MIASRLHSLSCVLLAGALGAGCQLLVTFETVPEGTGGGGAASTGGTGGATTTSPPSCTTAKDCGDEHPCAAHVCENSLCTTTPLNEGMTPTFVADPPGDCVKPVCQAGVLTDVLDKTQSPDADPDDCTITVCLDGGELQISPDNEGALCGMQPLEQCKKSVCAAGTCAVEDLQDGTVIDPGDPNTPSGGTDCRDVVCQGGAAVLSPNFLNCVDAAPGNCTVPLCNSNGQCQSGTGMIAPAGYPCDTNGDGSPDGTCDGVGNNAANCKP